MKLSHLKEALTNLTELHFVSATGEPIPAHFHITEVGENTRHFVDCGGTVRLERTVSLQLWVAEDTAHRLTPEKMLQIIASTERKIPLADEEIEVHYQGTTIGRYGLRLNGQTFELSPLKTACLAEDQCGIPAPKAKVALVDLTPPAAAPCCAPGTKC